MPALTARIVDRLRWQGHQMGWRDLCRAFKRELAPAVWGHAIERLKLKQAIKADSVTRIVRLLRVLDELFP